MRKVLILAPHTDDGELGCGGAIAKFIESGDDVYYAVFSICEESVSGGYPSDILEKEVKRATASLGIPAQNLFIFRYPVRNLCAHRQEILDDMISIKHLRFDIVFMPSLHDIHQDHITIAQEGVRAFKQTTILSYELPWNNLQFSSTAFIPLERRHVDKKAESLQHYESQQNIRDYMDTEFMISLAKVRGVQIGKEYAEIFEVVRMVME